MKRLSPKNQFHLKNQLIRFQSRTFQNIFIQYTITNEFQCFRLLTSKELKIIVIYFIGCIPIIFFVWQNLIVYILVRKRKFKIMGNYVHLGKCESTVNDKIENLNFIY